MAKASKKKKVVSKKKAPVVAEVPAGPKKNIGARSLGTPARGIVATPNKNRPAPHAASQGLKP